VISSVYPQKLRNNAQNMLRTIQSTSCHVRLCKTTLQKSSNCKIVVKWTLE